jgi:hypothetical protein
MKRAIYYIVLVVLAHLQLNYATAQEAEQLVLSKCKLQCDLPRCLSHCVGEGRDCLPVSCSEKHCENQCSCVDMTSGLYSSKAIPDDLCQCHCNAADKKGACVIHADLVQGSNECDSACYQLSKDCKRRGQGCGSGHENDCYGIGYRCSYRECQCGS